MFYADSLERLAIPFFERYRLCDIDRKLVRKYIKHLEVKHNLAPASVKKNFAVVKSLFATAYDDEDIRSDPATNMRLASKPVGDDESHAKAPTHSELVRVMEHIPDRYQLMFKFSHPLVCGQLNYSD